VVHSCNRKRTSAHANNCNDFDFWFLMSSSFQRDCDLCGKQVTGAGHNAAPVHGSGVACDSCNTNVVSKVRAFIHTTLQAHLASEGKRGRESEALVFATIKNVYDFQTLQFLSSKVNQMYDKTLQEFREDPNSKVVGHRVYTSLPGTENVKPYPASKIEDTFGLPLRAGVTSMLVVGTKDLTPEEPHTNNGDPDDPNIKYLTLVTALTDSFLNPTLEFNLKQARQTKNYGIGYSPSLTTVRPQTDEYGMLRLDRNQGVLFDGRLKHRDGGDPLYSTQTLFYQTFALKESDAPEEGNNISALAKVERIWNNELKPYVISADLDDMADTGQVTYVHTLLNSEEVVLHTLVGYELPWRDSAVVDQQKWRTVEERFEQALDEADLYIRTEDGMYDPDEKTVDFDDSSILQTFPERM